jgi:hypothetical protein
VRIGRTSIRRSSKLRYRQGVDVIVLRVGSQELHEDDLPVKVKSSDQAVVSSGNFEPDTLAVQHLALWSSSLDIISRSPTRHPDKCVPTPKRDLGLRMPVPETNQHMSGDNPHGSP